MSTRCIIAGFHHPDTNRDFFTCKSRFTWSTRSSLRCIDRCPVNGRMTRMTAINVSASISWFTAIDNIDMRAYTLSTHASLKRGSPSPARALRCLHWSPIPPPSLPIQFILTREFAHLFLPDLIDGRVPRWRDLRDHARRIDTPSKNGVWWIANKPTSLE